VGSFSETAPTFSPFRCRKIATAQEAKKWLQNDELWEGVQRVAQNDLFTQFQAAGGKGALINEFGQALAQFFHTQQSSLKAKIASKQLKPEPTYLALYSIALGAFTEYAAAQTADVLRQIDAWLAQCGSDKAHIVEATIFLAKTGSGTSSMGTMTPVKGALRLTRAVDSALTTALPFRRGGVARIRTCSPCPKQPSWILVQGEHFFFDPTGSGEFSRTPARSSGCREG